MNSTNLFDLYEMKKFFKVLASTLTIAAFAAVLISCGKDPDPVGQVDATFENISGFTIGFSREMSETESHYPRIFCRPYGAYSCNIHFGESDGQLRLSSWKWYCICSEAK
jgi:hypothetical protein